MTYLLSHSLQFPNAGVYGFFKLVVLSRDLAKTFNSWKAAGWQDVESLICCYQKMYHVEGTESGKSHALIYERLAEDSRPQIELVCS